MKAARVPRSGLNYVLFFFASKLFSFLPLTSPPPSLPPVFYLLSHSRFPSGSLAGPRFSSVLFPLFTFFLLIAGCAWCDYPLNTCSPSPFPLPPPNNWVFDQHGSVATTRGHALSLFRLKFTFQKSRPGPLCGPVEKRRRHDHFVCLSRTRTSDPIPFGPIAPTFSITGGNPRNAIDDARIFFPRAGLSGKIYLRQQPRGSLPLRGRRKASLALADARRRSHRDPDGVAQHLRNNF